MSDRELIDASTEGAEDNVPAIISSLIAEAVATFDADRSKSRQFLLRAAAILQGRASQKRGDTSGRSSRGGLARWQLNRVVDYIDAHLAERITGQDLAALIDVSIGQFFRAFKVSVGIPPLRYVVARRLESACTLLRTTRDPLSQIALTAGFCDQSHFCRVFRRVLHVTPAAWRSVNSLDPKLRFREGLSSRSDASLEGSRQPPRTLYARNSPGRPLTGFRTDPNSLS